MLIRLARILCLIAATQLLGGHWLALQSVAWMGMVVNFAAQEESLSGALEKTFDGAHPCGLCKVVQRGQGEEKKQEVAKTLLKLDAVLAPAAKLPLPREMARDFPTIAVAAAARELSPPTPPPLA